MTKLTIGQESALSNFLCDFPDNLSFEQIIFRLINNDLYDDDDNEMVITIWEMVEDWDLNALGEQIQSIANHIDQRNLIAYGEIK